MSDVQAAAERLRQLEADPANMPAEYRTCSMHEQPVAVICDRADVARAYLAEHPADDAEPVTEEWLRAAGLPFNTISCRGPYRIWNVLLDSLRCQKRIVIPAEAVNNRGDIRRLCTALGIPLKQ